MSASPVVISVILNTNRRVDTLECLSSIERSTYDSRRTIVLDNASTDGSSEAIRASFPGVQVISLQRNLGYTGNNNVGIRCAMEQGADWVFVLNEDTLVAEDCITQLVSMAESDPDVGIVGPLVYHHNEPTVIQSAGGKLDNRWLAVHVGQNEPDNGQYNQPRQVDFISGCAILVRRPVIEQIGGLEERFFYYWEETDWCARAREHGWKVLFVPQARLWHKGVQRDYHPGPNVTYYNTRNRLGFLARHHAPFSVWCYAWTRTLLTLTSWSVRPKWRGMRGHRDAMWQGMLDYFRGRWGMRSVEE
jgi:GT2 family glycosyltransferase